MIDKPSAQRDRFQFSLANLLRAITWLCIGCGGSAALFQFRDDANIPMLGFFGTVAFFVSLGTALGALVGQTKAGIVFGVVLVLVYCILAVIVAVVIVWFFP